MLATGPAVLEIPHQAYADAGIIDLGIAHVAAAQLIGPTWTDFDFAFAGIFAVADDKMISESVFHAAPTMTGVIGFGIAILDAAVVEDNVPPAFRIDFDFRGGGNDLR